ncbi:MAG: hypothetical protein V1659_00365, partial [Candidatus Woesearchaeota archaeon]
ASVAEFIGFYFYAKKESLEVPLNEMKDKLKTALSKPLAYEYRQDEDDNLEWTVWIEKDGEVIGQRSADNTIFSEVFIPSPDNSPIAVKSRISTYDQVWESVHTIG